MQQYIHKCLQGFVSQLVFSSALSSLQPGATATAQRESSKSLQILKHDASVGIFDAH